MAKKILIRDLLALITPVVTVTPDTNLRRVAQLMTETRASAVVISENGKDLAGIFTERDMISKVISAGLDVDKTSVAKVMTTQVKSISPEANTDEALTLMNDLRVRHLPVLDANQKLLGVISILDLLNSVMQNLVESFLEQ